jgi:fatty-acyl-CoA synthase
MTQGPMSTAPPATRGNTGGRPATRAWLRALELTAAISRNPTRILPTVIDDLADRRADAPALLSERETFTFAALAARASQYARWALAQGLKHGDRVCLIMPNRPEYMAAWLGVTRVGGVMALVNSQLRGESLARLLAITQPRHIVVAAELADAMRSAQPYLKARATIWSHGSGTAGAARIDQMLDGLSRRRLDGHEHPAPSVHDDALIIYTSGTTGLPKGVRVSHHRVMMWSYWLAGMIDTQAGDRLYDCLPMYHSIGGVAAPGAVLVHGGSVVLAERFSAGEFWDAVRRWDCTLIQYIGEICRYLVNTPPGASDRAHRVRLACGNGLGADIWDAFRQRFSIPQILEFYASTEGNVRLFNYEERCGAIGRVPPFLAHRAAMALIRHDVDSGRPQRGADGLCIRCIANEVGEAIGRIRHDAPGTRFEGYTSPAEAEEKILRDVFEPGDIWFRSGDLMRQDEQGYAFFVDRIGDTFRRKGENVSTTEVAAVIAAFPGIRAASVYGVAIPKIDGRAGMAALVADAGLDLLALRQYLVMRLPAYARPLFLRIRSEVELTGSFRQNKAELVRQGYDPTATSEPIYFDDPARGAFVRLDAALFDRINSGAVRL